MLHTNFPHGAGPFFPHIIVSVIRTGWLLATFLTILSSFCSPCLFQSLRWRLQHEHVMVWNRFILVLQIVMRGGQGINPVSSWQSRDWSRTVFLRPGYCSIHHPHPSNTYWAAERKCLRCAPSTYDSKNKIQLAAGYKSQNITFLPKILRKTHLF